MDFVLATRKMAPNAMDIALRLRLAALRLHTGFSAEIAERAGG
jgi:hypothetical protein